MKKLIFVIALLLIWNGLMSYELYTLKNEKKSNYDKSASITVLDGIFTDITALVASSEPKVVMVSVAKNDTLSASGSGIIYKKEDTNIYIVTNAHVINSEEKNYVTFYSGEALEAKIVGIDTLSDVAVLSVEADFDVATFKIADSDKVKKGEYVIAIGSPINENFRGSISFGIISGLNRNIGLDQNNDNVVDWEIEAIQTDAAINIGNSGGPLINISGELIGMTSLKLSSPTTQGMGFALGSNDVVAIADKLISDGSIERPFIGLRVKNVSNMTVYQKSYYGIALDITSGVYVSSVSSNGYASVAGLKVGDIITDINNKKVTSEKDFNKIIYNLNTSEAIKITYLRNNESQVGVININD